MNQVNSLPVDKIILHGLVVTMDQHSTILEDGAIAICGPRIAAVGPSAELAAHFSAMEVIDAKGGIAMPGLINTHTHAPAVLFRGLVEDLALEPWLQEIWAAERDFVRPETVELGAKLAYAEMIRGGTTTALDMYMHPNISVDVARQVGFRLMTGPSYIDVSRPGGIPIEQRTAHGREFLQGLQGDSLIVSCVLPHSTYTIPPIYLQQAQRLAEEFGVVLSAHLSETETEVATITERHGLTPPRLLDKLGLLSNHAIMAHCVHLSDDEIDLLATRGTAVAHCPLANLKLGSGIARVNQMLRAGVCVTIGTDGAQSSNDLDLWIAMRFTATLPKGLEKDPTYPPALEVVKMVTSKAALGLGQEIGSLEVGKRADIILIDLDRPHLVPMYDVYTHLVYTTGRDDVSTVLINGQLIMQDRHLLTLKEAEILANASALSRKIAASADHLNSCRSRSAEIRH